MRRFFFCTAVLFAAMAPTSARANGRFPAANQLVASPSDPDLFVLRATYGQLYTHDHGLNWDWVCEAAVGFVGTSDPSIGLTQKNAVVLGKFDGLEVSPDTGCSWTKVPTLSQQFVSDVVIRPDDPHTALLVTSSLVAPDAGSDAGYTYSSSVYRSTDDGANWATWGNPVDPSWVISTIEVAAQDPHRIYLSATKGKVGSVQTALIVSKDDGVTWTPHLLPTDPTNEPEAFIGAVDPANPDRVYIRTGSALPIYGADGSVITPPSRLLITDDGGTTFKPVLTLTGQMMGFALSVDGSKVYVGGPVDGVMSAKTADFVFTQTSKIHVQCLKATQTELWACSDEASGFVLGVSTDWGGSFAPKLHLNGIRQPLKCPGADSSTTICDQYFEPTCEQLGGCAQPDAGPVKPPSDAGADAGVTPPPPAPSSCGCSVGPAEAGVGGAALLGALVVLLMRRRRAA